MTLRLTIVNPVWAEDLHSPEALFERYQTLTGWARAVAADGIDVCVLQRFTRAATMQADGVTYHCVADSGPPVPPRARAADMVSAVAATSPHVVHINGVVFPGWTRAVRHGLGGACRVVVQDHGGWHPNQASRLARWKIRRGISVTDALLVSSPGQVASWRKCGVLPPHVTAFDVMESSVDLQPVARDIARANTRMTGSPAILCVGRLTRSKDPMTAIEAFTRLMATHPDATLTWLFRGGELEAGVRAALDRNRALAARVRLIAGVPHRAMADFYSAADLFVSASRAEGSGYASLEAMACGVVPVLTDIPSFRAMTGSGRVGHLWPVGDARACADALARAAASAADTRHHVRAWFDATLSWAVVGRRAAGIYRAVCAR